MRIVHEQKVFEEKASVQKDDLQNEASKRWRAAKPTLFALLCS